MLGGLGGTNNEQSASIIMSIISKKICIIGEAGVSSNSLIDSSVDCQFGVKYLSTVGVTISRKIIELPGTEPPDQVKLQLVIWNVAENDKYKAISPSYFRGSSGAIIVADINRPETIERIPDHIQLFSSINPKSFIIVALNTSDLMAKEKLIQLKNYQGVTEIYITSVKTGLSVDKIFQQIAYKLVAPYNKSSLILHPYPEIEDFADLRRGEIEK